MNITESPWKIGISVFIITIVVGYLLGRAGFHVQDLKIVQGGDVVIVAQDLETNISLDNNILSLPTTIGDITLIENLAPGIHPIIVFNDDHWPWKKDVVIRSQKTTELAPFLIKKNPSGIIITENDPEFETLKTNILNNNLPTRENPLLSPNSLVHITAENDVITATWLGTKESIPTYFCNDENICSEEIVVLASDTSIRNTSFFKNRDDVLIVSSGQTVFAIEIDRRGNTQNFQPIYKGTEFPRFINSGDDSIYVLNGSAIFLINL